MKLDRNINPDGRGKYALVLLREVHSEPTRQAVHDAIHDLTIAGCLDFGPEKGDFFVIRLKDKYAAPALAAYAIAAFKDDPQYANDVMQLAYRACAGELRKPD